MVMVRDPETGKVLVEERVLSWCGISFPGGHVEKGESPYDSAVREVYEETGLTVHALEPCGHMCWYNTDEDNYYLIFFYRTESFSGTLSGGSEEGRVFWAEPERLPQMKLARNFGAYLDAFLKDGATECYCAYGKDTVPDESGVNPWHIRFSGGK